MPELVLILQRNFRDYFYIRQVHIGMNYLLEHVVLLTEYLPQCLAGEENTTVNVKTDTIEVTTVTCVYSH
jgi:hypothetical protein